MKCEFDVFLLLMMFIDVGKIMFVFQIELVKFFCVDYVMFIILVMLGNEDYNLSNFIFVEQYIYSSCLNLIDSYVKGDWDDNFLDELWERLESLGDFLGDYQYVMCLNYSLMCVFDFENIDICFLIFELI